MIIDWIALKFFGKKIMNNDNYTDNAINVAIKLTDVLNKETRLLFPENLSENEFKEYCNFKLDVCAILTSAIMSMVLNFTKTPEIQLISGHLDKISESIKEDKRSKLNG